MTIKEFSKKVDEMLSKLPEKYNGSNNPSVMEGIKIFQERMVKKFLDEKRI